MIGYPDSQRAAGRNGSNAEYEQVDNKIVAGTGVARPCKRGRRAEDGQVGRGRKVYLSQHASALLRNRERLRFDCYRAVSRGTCRI